MLSSAKLDTTGHRWVAQLANYDFDILYKSGKKNIDADSLSRMQWPEAAQEVTCQSVTSCLEGVPVANALVEAVCLSAQVVPDADVDGLSLETKAVDWKEDQRQDADIGPVKGS